MFAKIKGKLNIGIGVSVVVLIGKAVGFAKQAIIAHYYGLNGATDVFFAADGFIAMIGQILLVSIPPVIISQTYRNDCPIENEKNYAGNYLALFGVIGIFLTIVVFVSAGHISKVIGVSFGEAAREKLQYYLRILSPVIMLASLAGCMKGELELKKIFYPSKMMGMFIGISTILFIFWGNKYIGIDALLFGFIVGYIFFTVFLRISIKIIYGRLTFDLKRLNVKNVIIAFLTVAAGKAVLDISHLFDKIIASSLKSGSISALYYGQIISSDLINATIISVYGMMMLPYFAEKKIEMTNAEFRIIVMDSIKKIISIMGAVVVAFMVEANDLARFFFEHGKFDNEGTNFVTSVVIAYAVGFLFVAFREIVTNVFYVFNDMKTPMIINAIAVSINIIMSYILSMKYGVFGIALATSISMAFSCIVLGKRVHRFIAINFFELSIVIRLIGLLFIMTISFELGTAIKNSMCNATTLFRIIIVTISILVSYLLLYIFISRLLQRKTYI